MILPPTFYVSTLPESRTDITSLVPSRSHSLSQYILVGTRLSWGAGPSLRGPLYTDSGIPSALPTLLSGGPSHRLRRIYEYGVKYRLTTVDLR